MGVEVVTLCNIPSSEGPRRPVIVELRAISAGHQLTSRAGRASTEAPTREAVIAKVYTAWFWGAL